MTIRKLSTTAVLLALPLGTALAPASAGAKAHPAKPHHAKPSHHRAKHGRRAARSVTFRATVVKSSAKQLVLRKADGTLVSFSAAQLHPGAAHVVRARAAGWQRQFNLSLTAGSVVVNLTGLEPGAQVTVTETIGADGTVTISIALPPAPAPSAPATESVNGVITDLGDDALTIKTSDGSDYRLHMAKDALAALNLSTCQIVQAAYTQDAGLLIAQSITPSGASTAGDCAPSTDTNGVISAISSTSVTITTDAGSQTYAIDPSSNLADGFGVGDLVDVTSTPGADGSSQATNIQYVCESATGKVDAVTATVGGGSLSLSPDDGSSPLQLVASPNGVHLNTHAFSGIAPGDEVEVDYHQAAGQLIADTVSEQ